MALTERTTKKSPDAKTKKPPQAKTRTPHEAEEGMRKFFGIKVTDGNLKPILRDYVKAMVSYLQERPRARRQIRLAAIKLRLQRRKGR